MTNPCATLDAPWLRAQRQRPRRVDDRPRPRPAGADQCVTGDGGSGDFFSFLAWARSNDLCFALSSFAICAAVFWLVEGFAFTAGAAAFRPSNAVPPAADAPRDLVSALRLFSCRAACGCAGRCASGLTGAAAAFGAAAGLAGAAAGLAGAAAGLAVGSFLVSSARSAPRPRPRLAHVTNARPSEGWRGDFINWERATAGVDWVGPAGRGQIGRDARFATPSDGACRSH